MTSATAPHERSGAVRGPRRAWIGGACGVAAYLATLLVWHGALLTEVDALIYRFGADRALHHRPIYLAGLDDRPGLVFNYPPFAAPAFLPLLLAPRGLLPFVVLAGNIGLLVFVIRRCLRAAGVADDAQLAGYTMLGVGTLVWLEPVRTHLVLGQVGLLLMALIVADLLPRSNRRARWTGVGIGIAAGIKLTPLLFLGYLLFARRTRAAAVAALTFLGTVATGFLLLPADSGRYWLHGGFGDTGRIAPLSGSGNVSLRGALIRLGLPSATLWLAVVAAVVGLTLTPAVAAERRGERVFALALVGMGSCAASPFSWPYHWVWLLPLIIHLATRPSPGARLGAAAVLVSCAAWITEWRSPQTRQAPPAGIVALHPGGWLEQLTRDWYLAVFAATLCWAVANTAGRTVDVARPAASESVSLTRSKSNPRVRKR